MTERTNESRPIRRVVITGSDGLIGHTLMESLPDRYELVGLARKPSPTTSVVVDITDLAGLIDAFAGADAIVHMAATSAVQSSWDAVLSSNLIGTYNVFEAARRVNADRVIFASSNHTIGTNEAENAPELYDLDDTRVWDEQAELRPDSLYGVSKVYGEALARYYVDHHGLRAFCLRIGAVRSPEDPQHPRNLWRPELDHDEQALATRRRMRAVWLSERDCVQLVVRCLESDLRWALVYGISNNPRRFWDIEHAKDVLGYAPQDAAPKEIAPGLT
jgi:nucleoside-diphosphate-sugar epimerase